MKLSLMRKSEYPYFCCPGVSVYLIVVILVVNSLSYARRKEYETGKLIDASPRYSASPLPLSGPLLSAPEIVIGYSFEIQVGSFTYFVNASMCCPLRSQYKPEWSAGEVIEFRFDKDRMFVRRPKGHELQAILVKVVQGNIEPLAQPHHSLGTLFQSLTEKSTSGKTVLLGTDFLRADDICTTLYGYLQADHFFDHLHSWRSADGFEFRTGNQRVETFPERMIVRVIAELGRCTAKEGTVQGRNISSHLDEDFMKSLSFEGSWKSGFVETPAELGALAEGRIPNPTPLSNFNDWWEYEFEVRSKGVSLNDALVIIIQSPDGRMVARLSARLPDGLR